MSVSHFSVHCVNEELGTRYIDGYLGSILSTMQKVIQVPSGSASLLEDFFSLKSVENMY